MEVKTVVVGPLETNCYIVSSGKKCVIIDPGDDAGEILAEVAAASLEVASIVLTHGHFDHFLASGEVQQATGAPVYVGSADLPWVLEPDWMAPYVPDDMALPKDVRELKEGDIVAVGSEELRVISTPGHSPGSLCLHAPGVLFSGDLLFRRGVGRTDLPGSDPDELSGSLQKVTALPGETVVYPGHGPSTTIGDENRRNPFLG